MRAATRLFRSGQAPQTLRLLGNIVDQGLSSMTNLLVSLFAAHLLGLAAFGVVSIVMTVYFVCIGIARAVVCEPLMLSKAHPHERLREVVGQVASTSFVLGLVFALATFVIWLVDPSSGLINSLAVLGVGMPFLLLQDVTRYVEFWRGTPWIAALNDLFWLIGSLAALIWLPSQAASAATVLACWVGSGALAGAAFAIYLGWRPSISAARSWVGANRRLIGPLLGDYGLISLLQQGTILMVTAIAGLRATAAFRGALVALGPVNVLTSGVSVFLIQVGRRSFDTTPKRLPIIMFRRSVAMSVAVLSMCVAIYFSPPRLGELMLGEVWQFARPLILPFAFVYASAALNFGATTGLRLIGEAGQSFRVRIVATPLMLITVAVACSSYGVPAAVWAQAMAGLVATGIWWWTFVFSHRRKFFTSAANGARRHRR